MSEPDGVRQTRVLIVDDEDDQRRGLSSLVSSWGYEVETAADGQEALEKLGEFRAHVMVTDLNMPRIDGFELLQRLSSGLLLRKSSVKLLTGKYPFIMPSLRIIHWHAGILSFEPDPVKYRK